MSDEAILRFAESLKARDEKGRANIYVMGETNPDDAGKANQLARDTGLPPDVVERNLNEVARQAARQRSLKLIERYPAIGTFTSNQRDAAVSSDDIDSLAKAARVFDERRMLPQFRRALRVRLPSDAELDAADQPGGYLTPIGQEDAYRTAEYVRDIRRDVARDEATSFGANIGLLPGAIGRQLRGAGWDILASPSGVIGAVAENLAAYSPNAWVQRRLFGGSIEEGIAREFGDAAAEGRQRAQLARGASIENPILQSVASGFGSTPLTAVQLVLARMGFPGIGSAAVAGSVAAGEYGKARSAAISPAQALLYSGTQGFIEYATEKVPAVRYFEDTQAGRSFGRTLLNNLMEEMPQEQAATVLQDLNDWLVLNPEKPFSAYLAERPDAALQTAIATAVGSTTVVTTTEAMGRLALNASKAAGKVEDALQARADAKAMDDLVKISANSKLRQRDPEALARFLELQTGDAIGENVYVPAEELATYFQSNDIDWTDPESGWSFDHSLSSQMQDALAEGGDVVFRTSDFIAHVGNTPAYEVLKPHIRTSAGGMSEMEAQAFSKDEDAAIKALGEQFAADSLDREDPRQKLYWSVRDKLTNAGFTQSAADANAALVAARYATRAARLGQELTGAEFDAVDVRQVLPEALAPVVAADQVDIAIQTMRQMRQQRSDTEKYGPSLLEWLSRRGGVEDRGGDLEAMGADRWHRGKPGRRKLIRPLSQGDALPGMAAPPSGFGLDDMALRAWEAGYFPGDERPSPNDLLAAIEAELAGKPRYAEDRTGTTDQMREAADQLYEIVDRQGIDPLKATDAEIRRVLDQYQRERMQGSGFDQTFGDGPRGRITFAYGRSIIDLFESRNLSTFIHESGHLWLEELRADAENSDAPEQLKADWQTVQDWFSSNGHPVSDGAIPIEAHEMFARGWERYTMEGKSPSSALRRIFDQFRAWLLQIYEVVSNLRAPITPEIRQVMDRLVATDEEIASISEDQAIEALFTEAAQAGMTEAEFAAYRESVKGARDEAFDALLFRTMKRIRAERTKAWKGEQSSVRADVAERVARRPEFRALHLLRTGRMLDTPDATPVRVKLDRQWLVESYGADVLGMLPKGVPPIYADSKTTAADEIAEMTGFASGDELVRTLIAIENRQRQIREGGDKRSLRQVMIDEETAAIMSERHGDPLNDGSIEEEALAAIHNDRQGEVIASELRALSRKTGDTPTPYRLARQWAARKIAQSQVVETTSGSAIQRYARAAAKASRAAQEAMLKGDASETFRQKQAQMLNNALLSEAKAAKDKVDVAVARLGKLARKRTIASISQDYLDQAHGLLEQVDFRIRTQRDIDRQQSFEDWANAQKAAGHDVVVPPSFAATLGARNWSRLSVEELIGLDDAVRQIVHLGRLKQKLLDGKDEREFNAVVDEALASIDNLPPKVPKGGFTDPSWWDGIKARVASMDASLLKMETVFDWLDNGRSDGVFNRVVFRRIADAQHRERAMVEDYTGRLTSLLKAVPKEHLRRWMDKVVIPELTDPATGRAMVTTRDRLISMALNMGNDGNATKLAGGYGWNEDAIMAVLNRELTEADWQYVQGVWDTIDTLWPEAQAMEKRLNGFAPEKVEARPVQTPFGTLKGGYFPVVYDPAKNYDAEAQAAKSADLFEASYVRANTRAGSLNERTNVKRPIHLSLGIINRHVTEVIHDITHREAIIDAWRFLSDQRVMRGVDETLGPDVRKQFKPWLQHIANEYAIDKAGVAAWEAFAKHLRTNTSMVGMGFRLSTVLMQIAGYSNSFERIGARWVVPQLWKVADPRAYRFVLYRSPEVASRLDNLERDIRENVKQLAGRTDLVAQARKFAFYGIGYMDRIVVIPTWLGAYNKAIERGASEADAAYEADKAVRQSQGAGAAKDLSAVQRGNEFMRLATMFYSYHAALYQRMRTLGRDIRHMNISDLPNIMARSFWLLAVPPILSELLAGRGPDDEEDWALWSAQKMLLSLFGPVPLARDVASAIDSGFGYKFTPASAVFQTGLNIAGDMKRIAAGDETRRATRNVIEGAGYTLGLPTGQLAAATQFIVDVANGDQDPETVGDWYEGLTRGKVREE